MDVPVSLARDSYHALYTSMRALYLYPALKKAGGTSSFPPVLSFLAPATLVKRPRRQLLQKTAKPYGRLSPLRPYSTIPKPPQTEEAGEASTSSSTPIPEEPSPEDPDTPPEKVPDFEQHLGKRERWRRVPYISRTAADTTVAGIQQPPRYITEAMPYLRPSTDEYVPRNNKIGTVGGVFGIGKAISADEMTRFLLNGGRRVQDIEAEWAKLEVWEKDFNIEDLIEWHVDMRRVHIAARILEAIHKSFLPETVGNCYADIIYGNLTTLPVPKGDAYWISFREKQARRLLRLLKVFLRPIGDSAFGQRILFNSIMKTQYVAYSICKNLPPEDLPAFFKHLVDSGIRSRTFTTLHFIDRLCKEGDYYKGFILMQCMVEEGRKLDTDLCRKAFTLLLSKATKAGNEQVSADILKCMYACKLPADTPIYNVLMYNAIKSGKVESALNIFGKIIEAGLEPNMVTYAHLFHLHKRTRNIAEQQKVVQMAVQKYKKLGTWMGADVVHAAALNAEKGRKFKSALEIYHKLYKPGMLALMGLVSKSDESVESTTKMDPDVVVVTIVTMAYLQDESDTDRIWQLYQRYKKLRDGKEHGEFFELQPVLANGFMHKFGQELRTMDKALEIMQDLSAPSKVRWRLKTGPNRYSWSVLARAFTRFGHLDEAKWVIKAMQRDGFTPTEVTWELLLAEYIDQGRAEEAGETLGMMLADGVQVKGKTLDMLLTVKNTEDFARGVERVGRGGGRWPDRERVEIPQPGGVEEKINSENWRDHEEARQKARAQFARELKNREIAERAAEQPKPPPLPDMSVDDI